jgi:hypothetical protein
MINSERTISLSNPSFSSSFASSFGTSAVAAMHPLQLEPHY